MDESPARHYSRCPIRTPTLPFSSIGPDLLSLIVRVPNDTAFSNGIGYITYFAEHNNGNYKNTYPEPALTASKFKREFSHRQTGSAKFVSNLRADFSLNVFGQVRQVSTTPVG